MFDRSSTDLNTVLRCVNVTKSAEFQVFPSDPAHGSAHTISSDIYLAFDLIIAVSGAISGTIK